MWCSRARTSPAVKHTGCQRYLMGRARAAGLLASCTICQHCRLPLLASVGRRQVADIDCRYIPSLSPRAASFLEIQFPLCGAGKTAALAAPASCSMSPTAAEHLKDEVKRALHLLHDLTEHNPPAEPLGKLQPALVKHCKVRHGCWCTEGTVEKSLRATA